MTASTRKFTYQALTRDECAAIHAASLEMLARTGCTVECDEARALLRDAGCRIDNERVRIPNALIEWALRSAPGRITLYNRLGQRAMMLEDANTYYGAGSDCPFTLDVATGERRGSTKADVANFARLTDALPHLDFVMSMGIAADAGQYTSFVHEFIAMVENTVKPIVFTAHGIEDMRNIYDMAVAVKGSADALEREPFLLLYSEPIAPQVHSRMGVEKLIFCARRLLPVTYPTGAMAGATAPATLAGAIALGNAETLVGLAIAQLARPGAPFLYGGNSSIMDMRTGRFTYGAPEFHLAFSAYADLARFYGLPVWGLAGATDAKVVDAQAGLEMGVQMLMAELSGAQVIHDVGYLDCGLCSSLELLCLGNETVGMVRRISRGIEVTPETLAVEEVDAIGPGGNFLETEHTLAHFKSECWFPSLLARDSVQDWQARGSPDLYQRLNQRVKELLATHQPEPLPATVRRQFARILRERDNEGAS